MAGAPVSLAELVRAGVEAHTSELYVARPGKVTAYDPLTNTVVVQPMVKHALYTSDGERVFEDLPEIPFVPVLFPRAGAHAITLPIVPGDYVLLVFCDVSLAEWREGGGVSEPVDARRHSLGWPVAFPGFFPDSSPLSPDPLDIAARAAGPVLGEHAGSSRIEIASAAIKLGKMAIDAVALATPTQAGLTACMSAANVAIAAAAGLIASYGTHTHVCAAAGAPSGPPVGTAPPAAPSAGSAPGAVAATLVKAI